VVLRDRPQELNFFGKLNLNLNRRKDRGGFGRGEPKDGNRSELDRFPKWLTNETGKENGIIAQIYDF
jgi:hypothetical protein